MIWLTWRQSRLQAASAALVLVAFAVLLTVTGPHLASLYASSPVGSCQGGPANCGGPADEFFQQLLGEGIGKLYLLGIMLILVAPAVIGVFWGAPLIARELEARTQYLAWNQSVTRTRWLAVKLTLTGLTAMAVTEALSLLQGWWATPISRAVARGAVGTLFAMNRFSPLVFATHGITPLGYAALAFALGVTAGVVVRHAVPAMAVTLALFALLQVVMPLWVRPHLFPPDHSITTLSSFPEVDVLADNHTFTIIPNGWSSQPEDWVLSAGAVNTAGQPVSAVPAACMQLASGQPASGQAPSGQAASGHTLVDCLANHGIRVAVTYQPASRYWAFQGTETAIYVALALALAWYCFWRISSRRLS